MKIKSLLLIGAALCLLQPLAAQSYLQDTIPETVVTATGTTHLLKDVPVQTEVITRKMLQDYAGRSLEDILGGLTTAFAFSEDDMGSHMQLGGLGNSYILILLYIIIRCRPGNKTTLWHATTETESKPYKL